MLKNIYSKIENVVGKKFGNLLVLDFAGVNRIQKRKLYLCKCDCGKEKILRSDLITRGKVKSCGCLSKRRGIDNPNYSGFNGLSLLYFNKLKRDALLRNLEFNITIDFLWNLLEKQNFKCFLSGQKIHIEPSRASKIEQTASVDRIDSSIGYIEKNVQWVHKDVNFMKQAFSQEKFINLCKLIVENNSHLR